jgi:hypothetical protein
MGLVVRLRRRLAGLNSILGAKKFARYGRI